MHSVSLDPHADLRSPCDVQTCIPWLVVAVLKQQPTGSSVLPNHFRKNGKSVPVHHTRRFELKLKSRAQRSHNPLLKFEILQMDKCPCTCLRTKTTCDASGSASTFICCGSFLRMTLSEFRVCASTQISGLQFTCRLHWSLVHSAFRGGGGGVCPLSPNPSVRPRWTPLQPPDSAKTLCLGSEFNQEVSRETAVASHAQCRPRPGFRAPRPVRCRVRTLWIRRLLSRREQVEGQRLDLALFFFLFFPPTS